MMDTKLLKLAREEAAKALLNGNLAALMEAVKLAHEAGRSRADCFELCRLMTNEAARLSFACGLATAISRQLSSERDDLAETPISIFGVH